MSIDDIKKEEWDRVRKDGQDNVTDIKPDYG